MRLVKGSNAPHSSCVSIHASVKDATRLLLPFMANLEVSIHASVKDATTFDAFGRSNTEFQSTHL